MNVVRLYHSPEHIYRGHHGMPAGTTPMTEASRVRLVAGAGVEGDRYSRLEGAKGQVTFFAEETWLRLREELGADRQPDVFRRNVIVRGAQLNDLVGRDFEVQGVKFHGVEYCKPCYWMEEAFAPGAFELLAKWNAGGLRASVLSGGWLAVDAGEGRAMLGVVLAGGEGRRMGRDKALVEVGGEPLWKRQVRVLQGAGAGRVVLARRPGQTPIDFPDCQLDAFADCGPLAGIHAALGVGGRSHVAVLAVDMPGIDAAWFSWLQRSCAPGVGAIAGHSGLLEPLAAIYPAEGLTEASARLERRELSVQGFARALATGGRMSVIPLPAAYFRRVASLNSLPV
jgi:molybdopterin-guanine dinucleotide biosynthesis protein A